MNMEGANVVTKEFDLDKGRNCLYSKRSPQPLNEGLRSVVSRE